MTGVGVLAAFSCMLRGVPAAERIDCGVEGLSGEMERARSVGKYISTSSSRPEGGGVSLATPETGTTSRTTTTHLLVALVSRCGPESAPPQASSRARHLAGHAARQAVECAARTRTGRFRRPWWATRREMHRGSTQAACCCGRCNSQGMRMLGSEVQSRAIGELAVKLLASSAQRLVPGLSAALKQDGGAGDVEQRMNE